MTDLPITENESQLVRQQSLAEQVFKILKERIDQGVFQSGNQLPTESQLAEELKVSRSTIRVAISKLEDRKLVQRRQGVGTYLRGLANIPNPLNEFRELTQLIKLSGCEPGYSTVADFIQPSDSIIKFLQLEPGSQVLRQKKIFTSNGAPIIYVVNHIPLWVFESVISLDEALRPDLTEKFLEFFEITCGLNVSHFVTTVRADIFANLDTPAELINDGPNTPVLVISETGFTDNDRPIVHSEEFHPGNLTTFNIIRNATHY